MGRLKGKGVSWRRSQGCLKGKERGILIEGERVSNGKGNGYLEGGPGGV